MKKLTSGSGITIEKVTVLYGGWSHETNFTAHKEVIQALKSLKIQVVAIDVRVDNFVRKLVQSVPDVVFITNQGAYGEDGKLQGLLECLDLRYTGSGVCASAVGMNKYASKIFFEGLGVNVPKYVYVPIGHIPTFESLTNTLGDKLVLKPLMAGGSFGVRIVENAHEFKENFEQLSLEYGELLIEEYIDSNGREYFAGIIEDDVQTIRLPVAEVSYTSSFYDHDAKYVGQTSTKIAPAPISKELTERLQNLAYQIHTSMGCSGMSRIDTIIREGSIYLIEINTLPSLFSGSLFPKQCTAHGISYEELIIMLLKNAYKRRPMEIPKLKSKVPTYPN